jgi:lipopolysaccharide transport system permease protein
MKAKVTIYNSNAALADSLLIAWRKTIKDVWKHRWLIWVNFKKDFFSQYKQAGLGMLWSLIMPIIPVSAYIFLGYLRVLNVSGGMPYPVYIMTGMTFWMLLREGISSGMSAIHRDRAILSKINIPLIAVILSRYGNVCANTLIRIFFLIIMMVFFRVIPNLNVILLPFVLLPLIFFSLGMGILLGIWNSVNTDIQNTVNMILTYGLFVSSVIFPMPTKGFLGLLNSINVFNHLIVGVRDFLIFGNFQYPVEYLFSSLMSISILILAVKWQHSLQYKVRNLL